MVVFLLSARLLGELGRIPDPNVPRMRALRRQWSRELRALSGSAVLRLANSLVGRGDWPRLIAYELIAHHPEALKRVSTRQLERLGRGLDNWGTVDAFACYLSGPAWREGQVPSSLIHRWARSPDRWWRRVALVSTVPLNVAARGGSGDARRTLAVCRLLTGDRNDMVVKALSWALRALATREPGAVRRFLDARERALAPRIKREVRNKLRTGRKNPG